MAIDVASKFVKIVVINEAGKRTGVTQVPRDYPREAWEIFLCLPVAKNIVRTTEKNTNTFYLHVHQRWRMHVHPGQSPKLAS